MVKKNNQISIIIPMYNAETVVLEALRSVIKQNISAKEIIIIDNHSKDNSVQTAQEFKKENKNIPIKIIVRDKQYGLSASYNLGAKIAKGTFLVTLSSDSFLPTENELRELVEPCLKNSSVIASTPWILHPEKIWKTYNFWQKYIFSRVVGTRIPSGNGKFDCIRKDIYVKIGGYDEKEFTGGEIIGGEDADFYVRLRKIGKIAVSNAEVIHLHYRGDNFSFSDVLKNKKLLARSYGRFLQLHGTSLSIDKLITLLVKPFVAFSPFVSFFHVPALIILVAYSFSYSKKMFLSLSTLKDPKILILPFVNIGLLYYEVFWMIEAFFYKKKVV